MAIVDVICPHCCSEQVVCNGYTRTRLQRYLCSLCNKTFQLSFTQKASEPGIRQQIKSMAMNGVGCRATARIMGISLNTVLRHLKEAPNEAVTSNIPQSADTISNTERGNR